MLLTCWSAKGGSGTSVIAAALASLASSAVDADALLVDLCGDQPAVLGLPDPPGPGVWDWLSTDQGGGPETLTRLAVPIGPGVRLLPCGSGPLYGAADAERAGALVAWLTSWSGRVVVDAGVIAASGSDRAGPPAGVERWTDVARVFAAGSPVSLLVLRACYVALRRAVRSGVVPTAAVLVREAGRALGSADVAGALAVPVCAEVDVTAEIARVVDAGLLAARLPAGLRRSLRAVA